MTKTFDEYYNALMTMGEDEKRYQDLINEENERFELSTDTVWHREKIKELCEKQHTAFVERMASVKEARPKREKFKANTNADSPFVGIPKSEDSKEFTAALEAFDKLSNAEKRKLWWHSKSGEIPVDESQKVDDETMTKLHYILVQTVIDFINEKNLKNVDAVSFSADGLIRSAAFGEWTPETDSFLSLEGIVEEKYTDKDGKEHTCRSRAEIGKSF